MPQLPCWPLASRRLRAIADLNVSAMDVRQYLTQVAHVDQRTADRAIPEMIDLGFSNLQASPNTDITC